jgi:hypothetical protein
LLIAEASDGILVRFKYQQEALALVHLSLLNAQGIIQLLQRSSKKKFSAQFCRNNPTAKSFEGLDPGFEGRVSLGVKWFPVVALLKVYQTPENALRSEPYISCYKHLSTGLQFRPSSAEIFGQPRSEVFHAQFSLAFCSVRFSKSW